MRSLRTSDVDGIDAGTKSNNSGDNISIQKIIPVLKWLPRYKKIQCISDIIAGVTLGLTMIPQSIAYAALAGLSAQVNHNFEHVDNLINVYFVHSMDSTHHS